jgi:2-keto-4-pentenoate hydratase/2-oxohepta-3-ene-1,7-dioic acid hydratase in catechol pathway
MTRLVTFEHDGVRKYGVRQGEQIIDLTSASSAEALVGSLGGAAAPGDLAALVALGDRGITAAQDAVEAGRPTIALDAVKILAPIPAPTSVYAIGRNYADHVAEAGGEAPSMPRLFPKYRTTVIGPGDAIVKPALTQQLDWEVEFAVVIGKYADHVNAEDALDHVVAYTLINDVSARDIQFSKPEQLVLAKNFRTFCPMGPELVTKDEVPDPNSLAVRSWVNGEPMQDSNTSQLIFNTQKLVEFLSSVLPLMPGDIISTGTPEGVGAFRKPPIWLKAGDEVRLALGDLIEMTNPVVDA